MSLSERQLLIVEVSHQRVDLIRDGAVTHSWRVSTSQFGLGTQEGSFQTPIGRFRICEKIGDSAPLWSIFKSRVRTGEIASHGGNEDLVLTRILWLEGIDPENANTKSRYIYFHGTNREDLIGTPASHGCIRLRNSEMVELFDLVKEGVSVLIRA